MMHTKELIYAHYDGLREGVRMYAWWKDGVQYVGTTGRTLREALVDIDVREKRELVKVM
jgi:hypothetical protein